jgi:hypothetical protein
VSVPPVPEDRPAPTFELFWESSTLEAATLARFAARLEAFSPLRSPVGPLSTPGPTYELAGSRDRSQRLLEDRRSERRFGARPLGARQLGALLAAVGERRRGGRVVPAAGGLNAVVTYVLAARVEAPFGGAAWRHEPDGHRLALVGPLPPAVELRRLFTLDCEGDPQAVVVFALAWDEVLARYGERGGRFALVEVGHAAAAVGLRLAPLGLVGYELGGTLDSEVEALLRIGPGRARVALAYAVGA